MIVRSQSRVAKCVEVFRTLTLLGTAIAGERAQAGLSVGRPCAWALHCNLRSHETDSLVEPCHSLSRSTKYPSHMAVLAHSRADERTANPFTTVPLGDDHHGYIAVRHSVGEGSEEADDLAILHGDQRSLGP